jgi:hypothetical protein
MLSFACNKGVHVIIHNQTYVPTDMDGFDVAVDTHTDLALSRTHVNRKAAPYGDCIKKIKSFGSIFTDMFAEKGFIYTQASCFDYCLQRNLSKSCQCEKIFI